MLLGPWVLPDGLGIIVVLSFFRLAVWDRFFDALRLLLGSSWDALGVAWKAWGVMFGLLGIIFGSPRSFGRFFEKNLFLLPPYLR